MPDLRSAAPRPRVPKKRATATRGTPMTVARSLEAYHLPHPRLESITNTLIVAIVALGIILSIAGHIIVVRQYHSAPHRSM